MTNKLNIIDSLANGGWVMLGLELRRRSVPQARSQGDCKTGTEFHLTDYWQRDRFIPVSVGFDGAMFQVGIDQVVKDRKSTRLNSSHQ